MDFKSPLFLPSLGFILTLVLGFWLSRQGKPYNGWLFNVHKLIALGTVILVALRVYGVLPNVDFEGPNILLLILAALSVIALFISGALMSAGKGEYRIMKLIHNIAPILGVLAMAGAVYLMVWK